MSAQPAPNQTVNTYEALFENSADPCLVIEDGAFIDCNQATLDILGYTAKEQLYNTPPQDLSPPIQPDGQSSDDKAGQMIGIAFEKGSNRFEWVHMKRNGQTFPVEVLLTVIPYEGKSLIHVVWQDITERKEAEGKVELYQRELQRLNQQLEEKVKRRTLDLEKSNEHLLETLERLNETQQQLVESEKMASLGTMVTGVAHEINTPLGVCLTASTSLNSELEQIKAKQADKCMTVEDFNNFLFIASETTDLLINNVEKAATLIQSFKQISADQTTEAQRIFNLQETLNDIKLSVTPKLKLSNVNMDIQSPYNIELDSYPGTLTRVIVNLIVNSIEHGFTGGEENQIHLSAELLQDEIVLRYRDNGKGIEPDIQSKVFDPFFTMSRGKGNTGLGMSMSYNLIAQKMGGSMAIDASVTDGACFVITLPLSLLVQK